MKNIDITAIILGICAPQRLTWLKQSVDYLDKQKFPFAQKIIAVDEFRGDTMPKKLIKHFESKGWIVLVDSHMSRVKSMDHAFSLVESEYIFYNEDDVQVTLPRISDLTELFKHTVVGRRTCGMVSLTLGGSTSHFPAQKYGDLHLAGKNILLENDKYLAFRRLEEKRNDFFFEFPALFIRTELFKLCHEIAKKKFSGKQVEMGLSKAWFKEKIDKKFFKCSLCRKNILDIVGPNPQAIFDRARLMVCLDPKQGSSPFGGNHSF